MQDSSSLIKLSAPFRQLLSFFARNKRSLSPTRPRACFQRGIPAKLSLPQQLQESSNQVCRAPCLQPAAAMESPAQAQKLQQAAACSSSNALEQHSPPHAVLPLQQHLQHLRLSPETPPRAYGDGGCPGDQSEGGSSSSSSCEDCSSSSSSTSSDTPPAAKRQLPLQRLDSSRQEDLPSSSIAATDSHQGDEAAVEPLLQDNPDRFTLGEIQ